MKHYVGIDLGGTNLKAGVTDENGVLLCKESIKTRADRKAAEIVRDMGYLAQNVIASAKLTSDRIAAIGVGAPGTPDNRTGVLIYANNLPFLNVPIRSDIRKIVDRPLFLDNDANVAALAESVAGAAADVPDSITVTLGTGVGGGIVVGRRIVSGFNGAAGEIGHMVLVHGGEPCTCGRRGCFETVSSAPALVRETVAAARRHPESQIHRLVGGDLSRVSARTAFEAARCGDAVAQGVVDRYIEGLAEGLANLVNLLMPDAIVIGGGVCNEGEALLQPLRAQVDRLGYYGPGVKKVEIRLAKMGNDAGIIGAAMMARACLADGLAG
jgi:glucokinase